jgi:ribonuclease PH
MNDTLQRKVSHQQIRPVVLHYDVYGFADASLLFELGNTKVLCSITLQNTVPHFLRGTGTGWLTAEYAMLPSATKKRTNRESMQHYRNSRSVEISRLIGRSFRSVVDLSLLGERTIIIDCDVLQADGGTRVASITAASCALELAQKRWLKAGVVKKALFKQAIAAISIGVVDNQICLDLDQEKDMNAQADFNFVMTKSGSIIEIQGTAEKRPVSSEEFESLKKCAMQGIAQLFKACSHFTYDIDARNLVKSTVTTNTQANKKVPFFSLANRQS